MHGLQFYSAILVVIIAFVISLNPCACEEEDFYKLLGVEKTATKSQIKKAFRIAKIFTFIGKEKSSSDEWK